VPKKEIILDIPEKVKILGINGSPRRSGNTSEMVKYTLKAAESMGYVETEYLNIADYKLYVCIDCKKCVGYNKPAGDPLMCYVNPDDEAHLIRAKQKEANGILLGYPVYKGTQPAMTTLIRVKPYVGGTPFFNEETPGATEESRWNKPFALISQAGGTGESEQPYHDGRHQVSDGVGPTAAWPTADAPEPQSSYVGSMATCQDGIAVYHKDAWTSGASRVWPPTTGIRQERTLRNLGRWLAVAAMMFKLGHLAMEAAEVKRAPTQMFTRYAAAKPKPGSVIDALIKEGKVTYVSPEELESRKRIRA